MNKHLMRAILFCIVALLLGLGIAWLSPARAEAALGNTGVPARCFHDNISTAGETLTCSTPSGAGVSFVNGYAVPAGYYFMVTDVWVTPQGGTTNAVTDFNLGDMLNFPPGTIFAVSRSLHHFRNIEGSTYGQHFNSPLVVVVAGDWLNVLPLAGSQQAFDIYVSGFLVTNLNYIPLASAP